MGSIMGACEVIVYAECVSQNKMRSGWKRIRERHVFQFPTVKISMLKGSGEGLRGRQSVLLYAKKEGTMLIVGHSNFSIF
jgi:hypothetical protein